MRDQHAYTIAQTELDDRLIEDYSLDQTEDQQSSYPCIDHLKQLESCRPLYNTDTMIPPTALAIVTLLPTHRWKEELSLHPDQEIDSYIVTGLSNGFHIGYQYHRSAPVSASSNMLAAVRNPSCHSPEISTTEISAGRVAGPFKPEEVKNVHVGRFGLIPKRGTVKEWRLILDLSFPPGASINGGFDPQPCSLHYPTAD